MADLDPPVTPPAISPAPPPPQRGVKATFSSLVDAFIIWLISAVTQFNLLGTWVSTTAATMWSWYQAAVESAASAEASAILAQQVATTSVAAVDLVATSSTSIAQGTGIKAFVIQTGKQFKPNMPMRIGVTASPGIWMDGYVRSYDPATGALSFQSQRQSGAGTFAAWTVMVTGPFAAGGNGGGGNTTYTGLNTTIDVFPTQNTLITASTQSGGALKFDNYLGFPEGYYLYEIVNQSDSNYANDLTIKDVDDKHLAYLAPNRSTPVHVKSNGEWIFPEASPVGKPYRHQQVASARIAGTNGTFLQSVVLDADRTLFLIYGISLHAIVFDKTANTWSGIVLIRSAWGGAGSVDNVKCVKIDNDNVLVASCPENSTAAQLVVVTVTGSSSITPGAAQTTAFGAASSRLVDLMLVGSTYVLAYVTSAGVTRMQGRTLSGTTVSAPGTEVVGAASTAPPTLVMSSASSVALISSNASSLTITPYTIAGTVLTVGTAIGTFLTSVVGLTVKKTENVSPRFFITFVNSTARCAVLYFTGSTPVLTAISNISSAVNTVAAIQSICTSQNLSAAVTGTSAGGEFLTEFSGLTDSLTSSAPTLLGSILPRYSVAAQTVGCLGTDYTGIEIGQRVAWMVQSTKSTDVYSFQISNSTFFHFNTRINIDPKADYAVAPPVPAIYTKDSLNKSVLSKLGSVSCCALGDGTKTPMYTKNLNYIGPMSASPQLIGDPANGTKDSDSSLWLAYSMGTDNIFTIEQVRMA